MMLKDSKKQTGRLHRSAHDFQILIAYVFRRLIDRIYVFSYAMRASFSSDDALAADGCRAVLFTGFCE